MPIIGFLFNRFSRAVLLMEALGIVLMLLAARAILSENSNLLDIALFSFVAMEYAFLRYSATKRWYAGAPRWSGIELQFKKAMVPTSYILAATGACILTIDTRIPLIIAGILLAIIAHVNIILICLHRRDRDPTPVNHFSSKAFMTHR